MTLVDGTGGLTLGNITASGALTATSTGGAITDAPNATINVTGTSTLAASNNGAAADITLDNASNNFAGAVNASGANVTLVDGTGGLTLGNITATGGLTANSTGGAITDAAGSTVTVSGSTTLSATNNGTPADITLDSASNNFAGAVNAAGNNVTLSDANSLTLGTVTSTGKLSLKSNGALNLGNTTVAGALRADSGGGDITQSGSLIVQGLVTLDAGAGAVTLTNAGNSLTTGSDIQASRYAIAGDARRDAAAAAALAQGAMPVIAAVAALPSATSAPQPLAMPTASGAAAAASSAASSSSSSSSSASSEGGAVTGASSTAGVTIDLRAASSSDVNTMAAVSLPKGTATGGAGFSFELPETVRALVPQEGQIAQPQASLPTGAPLPSWLKFDPERLRFDASAVPDGSFPLQVVVTVAGQRVIVVISERTE